MEQKKEISKASAIELYKKLDSKGKQLLEEQFGKDFFDDGHSKYESMWKKLNIDPEKEFPFKNPTSSRQKKANAFIMLDILREAHGKHPTINDRKWYPIFEMTTAGFVFSDTYCEDWCSDTDAVVGSPFVFLTSQEAEDFGKEHNGLYNEILSR